MTVLAMRPGKKDDSGGMFTLCVVILFTLLLGGIILQGVGHAGGGYSTAAANTSIGSMPGFGAIIVFPFAIVTTLGSILSVLGFIGLVVLLINYEFFKACILFVRGLCGFLSVALDRFFYGLAVYVVYWLAPGVFDLFIGVGRGVGGNKYLLEGLVWSVEHIVLLVVVGFVAKPVLEFAYARLGSFIKRSRKEGVW